MSDKKCGHPRKDDGEPCGSWTFCDQCGRCFIHCEHVAEERAEARRKGGYATAKKRQEEDDPSVPVGECPPAPEDLEDAAAWASWAMVQNATGRLGNARARTIAKLLDVFRKALERGEARRDTEEAIQRFEEALERSGAAELKAVP